MLKTFHIIAIFQAVFLLLILFKKRKHYYFNDYFFLSATLTSLFLYVLGNQNASYFSSDYDLFLVDSTLFITFLFLFLNYFNQKKRFKIVFILPFFIPVVLYASIESFELLFRETYKIDILEHLLFVIFLVYLIISLVLVHKKIQTKVLKIVFYVLIISLIVVYSTSIFTFFTNQNDSTFFSSILTFEIAGLFYYLTYSFIFDTSFIHIPANFSKYKNSSLNLEDVSLYSKQMIAIMETEKLFLDANLSLQTFSDKVSIPKHFISEILNIHLLKTFTQFVNEYRIKEFIVRYTNDENNQFTIFGIANSVGFKNKATFNTFFKKSMGISPSEYPKN